MFKKIVSQLSFSPALVGQLGFYAKRLRREETTRRMGLIFVALALVVQSLVVFQAPEPANASSSNDFVPGGLGYGSDLSINNFLKRYDKNDRNLKDIMTYAGITRSEIAAMKFSTVTAGQTTSYGFENRAGSKAITVKNTKGTAVKTIYGRPMTVFNYKPTDKIYAFVGHSKKAGWFALIRACGNLATKGIFTPQVTTPAPKPTPKPTPKPSAANIVSSKTGVNTTQKVDATKTVAREKDVLTYTVQVRNTGGTAAKVTMKDELSEVMNFASLTDRGGGTYNATAKTLTWPAVNVNPGASVTKKYSVKMNNSLMHSTTECSMENTFLDSSVNVKVGCKTPPADVQVDKTATNVTQGNVDATTVTAQADDRITFTLTAENKGGTAAEFTFDDTLSDVLEYATLVSTGGGTYDEETQKLSWPVTTLDAGEKEVRTFTVALLSEIPATPKGVSDASSYDCRMENTFYDAFVVVDVECPAPKVIEQVVPELPQTGPGENIAFGTIVLAVVAYFYFRSRQLGTEVRLIRRDVNGGTI